jgi:hypothetical protein
MPDVSGEMTDEQGENVHLIRAQRAQYSGTDSELTSRLAETRTLDSYTPSEIVTLEGNLPHPVMRASVRPTDDPYTTSVAARRPL